MSVNAAQCLERDRCIAGKIPFSSAPPDTDGLPDMHLALYNDVLLFDQASGWERLSIVVACCPCSCINCGPLCELTPYWCACSWLGL